MLLQLSDSLVNYNQADEEKVLHAVAKLLHAYKEGTVLLTASVFVCAFFESKISDITLLKVLHHIDQNRAQLPSVLWRISIVLSNPDYSRHELSLFEFEKSDFLIVPFFLSENINDIELYDCITKAFYPDSYLYYIPAMGGGSATSSVLKKIRRFGFVLVIVDSDKKYKGADIGGTADKCKKEIKVNNTFAHLEILNIHEVENLVPLSSIKRMRLNRESRNFFKKILTTQYFDFLPFYDYKEGICVSDMQNNLCREFAEQIYLKLYCKRKNKIKEEFSKYVVSCTKKQEKIFPGLRRDLVDSFLENARSNRQQQYRTDILSYDCFHVDRKRIADLVFTFCCARGVAPIN